MADWDRMARIPGPGGVILEVGSKALVGGSSEVATNLSKVFYGAAQVVAAATASTSEVRFTSLTPSSGKLTVNSTGAGTEVFSYILCGQ